MSVSPSDVKEIFKKLLAKYSDEEIIARVTKPEFAFTYACVYGIKPPSYLKTEMELVQVIRRGEPPLMEKFPRPVPACRMRGRETNV